MPLPVPVDIDLVNQDRSMLTAVPSEVALAIAVHVEPPDHAPALHWLFPHASKYSLAPPRNVARETDIHW